LSGDLGEYVQLPEIRGDGKREILTYRGSPMFREYQKLLAARIEAIEQRGGKPEKGDDIILTVIGDGRHAAIDMRMVNPSKDLTIKGVDADDLDLDLLGAARDNDPGNKLNGLIDNVVRIWRETSENRYRNPATGDFYPIPGAAQMIFSDLGTLAVADTRGFSAYGWMIRRLVAAGIPREQIAIMQEFKKASAKQRLFNAVNSGLVRVLIGSSETMGTGVNAQQRLVHLHHLDAPWLPSSDRAAGRPDQAARQPEPRDRHQRLLHARKHGRDHVAAPRAQDAVHRCGHERRPQHPHAGRSGREPGRPVRHGQGACQRRRQADAESRSGNGDRPSPAPA
jgi:hypothetical protein